MGAVLHPKLSPLSAASLAGLTLTPRESTIRRECGPTSDVYVGLEPLDEPAEPVVLLLDEHEQTAIKVRAEALAEAAQAARAADQRLGEAQALARQIERLEERSGVLAAKAFGSGTRADKQAVLGLNAQLDEARAAQSAIKTLRAEAEEAGRLKDAAFGALRVLANACLANLRQRAADEYTRLCGELLRTVSTVTATLELQAGTQEALWGGWHGFFLAELQVPAMPEPLRNRADAKMVENHSFRDMVLVAGHSRLTAHEQACRSNLLQQLQGALAGAGLTPSRVL